MFVSAVLIICIVLFFVFFFKQKTAYEMRISDWSSDVCSSDLSATGPPASVSQRATGAAPRGCSSTASAPARPRRPLCSPAAMRARSYASLPPGRSAVGAEREGGFTLLEMLVALSVISLAALALLPPDAPAVRPAGHPADSTRRGI